MNTQNTAPEKIEELVFRQREFFSTGKTKAVPFRKEMLSRLHSYLKKWEKPLCEALQTDLNKCYEEAYMTEIGILYSELSEAERKVGKWARKRRTRTHAFGQSYSEGTSRLHSHSLSMELSCAAASQSSHRSDFSGLYRNPQAFTVRSACLIGFGQDDRGDLP